MPLYEFACRECGERFELLQRFSDPTPECPSCRRQSVTKLISLVAGVAGSRTGNGATVGCACGGACSCRH